MFQQSQNPLYQKMFQEMRQQKMPEKNEDGIQKYDSKTPK